MKLSILMPVYNERTMVERCTAQVLAAPLPEDLERELVMVDDRSTDGTWDILTRLAAQHPEKVAELKELFWAEAERYRVLPLLATLSTFFGILPPITDETTFEYRGDVFLG